MRINATIFYLGVLVCLFFSTTVFSTIIYSNGSTNWNDTNTWLGGVIPTNADTVIIDGHSVFIQSSDSVSVLRLELHNAKNIGTSSLAVRGNAALKILGNLYMTADSYDRHVLFLGEETSRIYVDGNTSIHRPSTNNKGEKLQLYLKNSSQFYNAGSFAFNYEGSSFFELNKEIRVEDFSRFEVNGATIFTVTSGMNFHAEVKNSAELILNGGLTMNLSGGLGNFLESDETSLLKITGNVELNNTSSNSNFLYLGTGSNGGNVIINGNLRLLSTEDEANSQLVSENGSPTITVTGNLTLEANHDHRATVKLGSNAVLKLGGNILRPNNFGELKMADFSVIELNGTTQQMMPSSKMTGAGGDSLYYRQVLFNNTGGFMLEGDMVVHDSLVLKKGVFHTSNDNMLIIADGGKISEGNDDAYIDGPMTKMGAVENVPFVFPLGDNGKYAPIEIIPLGTSATSSYTGQYDKCPPPFDKITSAPLDQISGTQFWTITRVVGSENFDVNLHWQDAEGEGINDLDSMVVAGLNATTGTWETMGNGGTTGGVGAGVAGSVRNDDKCPPPFDRTIFTLGTHTGLNALPSEMVSFTGREKNGNVRLDWVTASEISSDLFIVERSTDGVLFEEIDRVNAQGNSNTLQHYWSEDKSPSEGVNYYRLQRVDLDGSTLPTEIVVVNFTNQERIARIYPNPVKDFVNIVLENENWGEVEIGVYNQNGQQIFDGTFNPSGSELNLSIDQINIRDRGVYTILYRGQGRTSTLRFIKVN